MSIYDTVYCSSIMNSVITKFLLLHSATTSDQHNITKLRGVNFQCIATQPSPPLKQHTLPDHKTTILYVGQCIPYQSLLYTGVTLPQETEHMQAVHEPES